MAKIKRTDNSKCWYGCGASIRCWGGMKNDTAILEKSLKVLHKVKHTYLP